MNNILTSEHTRQALIDAFWTLFEKKSIRRITIREVTDLAGVHRNTFYRYFYSTYDLVDQVENQIAEQFYRYTTENMLDDESEAIKSMFMQILENEDKYFRQLIKKDEETLFSVKLRQKMFEHMRRHFTFSANEAINDYIIEYIAAGSIAAIARYFNQKGTITASELVDIDMKLIFTDAYAIVLNRRDNKTASDNPEAE